MQILVLIGTIIECPPQPKLTLKKIESFVKQGALRLHGLLEDGFFLMAVSFFLMLVLLLSLFV
jgi:hypothetical protein